MKNHILILVTTLFFSCSKATIAPKKTEFSGAADYICKLVQDNPDFIYSERFHKSFIKAVPQNAVTGIFAGIFKDHGECKELEIHSKDGLNGSFLTVHSDSKLRFTMNLVQENGVEKIAGLMFKGKDTPALDIQSHRELRNILSKKDGRFTFLFTKLNGDSEFEFNSTQRQPLGSVFKLYILAALIKKIEEKKLKWSQQFPILEKLKSLPSGSMQNLKAGTRIDLYEYALKMISVSDNTATDHLLNIVGKKNVERLMKEESLNSFMKDNRPFLSTLEMFKTRGYWEQKDVDLYVASSREQRKNLIDEIPFVDRATLLKKLAKWSLPKYNNEIEWFGSSRDICGLYSWLDSRGDKQLRQILSANTPFIKSKKSKRWNYVGYKGGSEPGVLEMAYLLEDKHGDKYCLYVGQSTDKKEINQEDFFSLVEGYFKFLEE